MGGTYANCCNSYTSWFDVNYPQIKADSLQLKHILFVSFESIVVVYRAKNVENCVDVPIFMDLTVYMRQSAHLEWVYEEPPAEPMSLRSKHAETDGLEIQTFAEEMSQFCLEWFECHNNNNTLSKPFHPSPSGGWPGWAHTQKPPLPRCSEEVGPLSGSSLLTASLRLCSC